MVVVVAILAEWTSESSRPRMNVPDT